METKPKGLILLELAEAEVREYARRRKEDVLRGAETPALAALMVEKYSYGMEKMLEIVADVYPDVYRGLQPVIDECLKHLDPAVAEHRKARWDSKPAGISITNGTI